MCLFRAAGLGHAFFEFYGVIDGDAGQVRMSVEGDDDGDEDFCGRGGFGEAEGFEFVE